MTIELNDVDTESRLKARVEDIFEIGAQQLADEQGRLVLNPDTVERDLAKLVLVVVELLRQLMEHEALARMDRGTLRDSEIDALSDALFRAKKRIEEMCEAFGIPPEDFNIDLGPLGRIL
ncbi:MAG: gas vesicle protein K [Sphingomonadales bacterium]